MLTLDESLQKEIINLRSPMGVRVVLYLLKTAVSPESNLCEEFKVNDKTMRKIGFMLAEKKIIKVNRDKESKEVFYILNKKFFDMSTCEDCKFHEKSKEEFGGHRPYSCNRKGPLCIFRPTLIGFNKVKVAELMTETASLEVYDRKINEREYRHVDKWDFRDFVNFYIEQWREYYPNQLTPERNETGPTIKLLIKTFRNLSTDNWRRLMKRYIWETMKFYSENKKVINIFSLNTKTVIKTFLLANKMKIENTEFCKHHDLYCTYYHDKCELPDGLDSCTQAIRDKMMRKYN